MGTDKLKDITNKPEFIDNIYNFCDRWCQRCGFNSNCEASVTDINNQADDDSNKIFWLDIEKQLNEAKEFVITEAANNNLSLTEFDDPKQKKNFDLFQRDAKSNDILKAGRFYEDMVDDWFDNAIENNLIEIIEQPSGQAYKLAKNTAVNNHKQLNDMFEVVLRYQLQVYLKLSRTFYSKGVEAEAKETKLSDSLGSAKAVLSLLDRSLAAWGIILNNKQFDYDNAFDMLLLIIRLRNNINLEFPDARKFIRQGLDE